MEWTREKRTKLQKMIQDRCLAIQDAELNSTTTGLWPTFLDRLDKRVMDFLGPLGFFRAEKDWVLDDPWPPTFKQTDTHLWFPTVQGRVVKIGKNDAEKILILGLP